MNAPRYVALTVRMELPQGTGPADVVTALEAIGARNVNVSTPRPPTDRPLGRME